MTYSASHGRSEAAHGWKLWLKVNSIYAIATCECLGVPAGTAELASAPVPVQSNTITAVDYSLAAGIAIGRFEDWQSTTNCLRHSYCQEAELPKGLAHSKVGLAAFKIVTAGVSILLQRYEIRHGHRTLARVASVNISVLAATVIHNNSVANHPPVWSR